MSKLDDRFQVDRLIETSIGNHQMFADSLLSAILIELRALNNHTIGGALDGNTEKVNETRETD